MKIDRLIGILSVLLQKERVTAPELAEHFEVSRRTINRDIEALCQAGIPIETLQGVNGGIRIMDGYRMDRTVLSSRDMQNILAGLRSLDSVSGSHYYACLMEKIKAGSSTVVSGDERILIDLSSWDKASLTTKLEIIRGAIEQQSIIRFRYFAPGVVSERKIEPYYLIFRWSSWYVYGYCLLREDFRLFKVNRMTSVSKGSLFPSGRNVPIPDTSNKKLFPNERTFTAVFEPEMKWQLVEDFGPDAFEEMPDGRLRFTHTYGEDEGLLSWMLSCRDKVTVLEPEYIRDKLFCITSELKKRYEKEG